MTHFFSRILEKVIVAPKLVFSLSNTRLFMRQNEVEKSAKIFHLLSEGKRKNQRKTDELWKCVTEEWKLYEASVKGRRTIY